MVYLEEPEMELLLQVQSLERQQDFTREIIKRHINWRDYRLMMVLKKGSSYRAFLVE